MKIKYLLIGLMISSGVALTSCGAEESTESTESESTEQTSTESSEEDEVVEEETTDNPEDYDDYSIQGQWDDIVFQVGTGDLLNLDMYVDYYAETFSEDCLLYTSPSPRD